MTPRRLRRCELIAVWTSRLLVLSAIVSLIAIPLRHWQGADIATDLLGIINIPADPSIFVVCLLLILAGAIRRRLRGAHTALTLFMILSVIDDVVDLITVTTEDIETHSGYWAWRTSPITAAIILVIGLVVLVAFVYARPVFTARLDRGSVRAAFTVLIVGLLVSYVVTLALTIAFPHTLVGFGQKALWALNSTFGNRITPTDTYFDGHYGYHFVYALSGWMSAAALLLALLVVWRSHRTTGFLTGDEELRVRRLLLRYGEDDSLGYFATRRDKSVVFSADGRAAVTFRNVGSISVASADPIGDRNAWPQAVEVWLATCRDASRHPAVLAASADGARVYRDAGLRVLEIGDEAIIDVDEFTLRGSAMKPVRQAVNRVTAAGYTYTIRRHSELSADELDTLAHLAEKWRGEETERGFSMALNRVGDPADGRCLVITALDAEGEIRGFLSFVPWGQRGISLDLMRRDKSAENGLNEYMVASLVASSGQVGIRRISLNFAVFRSVFSEAEKVGAGPMTRLLDSVLGFFSKFYQLETLYRSNDKYRPAWVPRTLCYSPTLTVMRAAIAVGTAEGFLPQVGPKFLVGEQTPLEQPRRDPEFYEQAAADENEARTVCAPTRRLNDQQRARLEKLTSLAEYGLPAYPVSVARTATIAQVREAAGSLPPDTRTDRVVSVVGRVGAVRDFGRLVFADLTEDGASIQAVSSCRGESGEDVPPAHRAFGDTVDSGDLISVTGPVFTTRSGELSIDVTAWEMAAKCLNPMPRPGAILADDVRVRNRTLDLLTNPRAVELLTKRSQAVRAMRDVLVGKGFNEVETPMLQAVHGGAAARPFTTHINAYDMDLFLRIAPELFLKRLAVAGMGKIFELNRNFRNEGADATHNPEFTSMEAYEAFGDYFTMRDLTREIILAMAVAINGAPVARRRTEDGGVDEVDLSGPWPSITVHEAVSRATSSTVTSQTSAQELAGICAAHDVPVTPDMPAGKMVMELYEALVEKQTRFPTFYFDFPVEVSPLARRHRDDPALTEQWDLVGFGAELGTAYSELTDPVDQRNRLTEQSLAAAGGDPEAMALDEDFLNALSYGMPPTGGLGLGVDRLIMMLAGVPIRPTLAFPFVKPKD